MRMKETTKAGMWYTFDISTEMGVTTTSRDR